MTVSLSTDLLKARDTHSNRPAATAVPAGALYSCSTHNLVYRSDGSAWSTWAAIFPPGGTTGQVPAKNSSTDYDISWATVSGGGGGSTVKDPRWNVLTGQTTVDEFNDSSLDGAWGQVNGTNAPSSSVTWTEDGDALSVAQANVADTGNAFHAMARTLTTMATGDAFITCVTLFAKPLTNYAIVGLGVADGNTYGSGKQVVAETYTQATDAFQAVGLSAFTSYTTSVGGAQAVVDPSLPAFVKQFIRLVYLGSSVWRSDRSGDGVSWIKGQTITVSSFTPTHVLLTSRKPSTGTIHIASFEFLRRVAGVT